MMTLFKSLLNCVLYVLTCQRTYLLSCLAYLRAHVLTVLAWFCAHVVKFLACSSFHVPYVLRCLHCQHTLRAHVPACLAGLLTCLTCLCAHAPTHVACVACSRTECVFRVFFIEYVLLSHLVLGREKPMA